MRPLFELKIKYYRNLFPDKSEAEVARIVFQELLDFKEKELASATRQHAKSNI